MNLHALKLFHETALQGSVTKAAEVLHISQPAVTVQIRNLEQELGVTLLIPHGRGVRLSECGELLHHYASRLFALELEMTRQVHSYRDGELGKIRMAATYLPANYLLPAWMAAFKGAHKNVEMILTTANSRTAFEMLLQYQVDLAFIGGSKEAPTELLREELIEDELCFIVPTAHPLAGKTVSLSTMMQEPFVLREEGSAARESLFALCRFHQVKTPQIELQFNGSNETIRAVMAGYGANFLSALEVSDYVGQGAVSRVYVEGVHVVNPIAVYCRANEEITPLSRLFLDYVRSQQSLIKKT